MVSDMMIKELGIGQTFLIFGILSLGSLIYFWKEMIESKGLNRARMEELYSKSGLKVNIDKSRIFNKCTNKWRVELFTIDLDHFVILLFFHLYGFIY